MTEQHTPTTEQVRSWYMGQAEGRAELSADEGAGFDEWLDEYATEIHGKGYDMALSDICEWLTETIQEWRELKIVNDSQYIPLLELAHMLRIRAHYTYNGSK